MLVVVLEDRDQFGAYRSWVREGCWHHAAIGLVRTDTEDVAERLFDLALRELGQGPFH